MQEQIHSLRIALVQHRAVPNDTNENLRSGIQYIKQAKEAGADIVLFPEMWSNGYAIPFPGADENPYDTRFEKERQQWLNSAVDKSSEYVQSFRNAAKEYHIAVVATYLSTGTNAPKNIALVISNTGEILMEYAKVHTCDFSLEALLESGDDFKVCELYGVKIGVMICFDREFPESARVLMLKGAELILVPNACSMNPARLQQLSTRAFENMVGVAMANYPSERHGQSCSFSPIVFDEAGKYCTNTIVMANDITEGIILADFDMDAIRAYRQKEVWGNAYRKVKTYHTLLDETVEQPFRR